METTISSKTSVTDICDPNIIKLRRLKIEEGLLARSILKLDKTHDENCEVNILEMMLENKRFNIKFKSSFEDIMRLFQDIKENTDSAENMKGVDINEVKRDILQLEKKIQSYTMSIQSELTSLKANEEKINKAITNNTSKINKTKRQPKIKIKPFNDIVPSPVKSLIHSPLKYSEVQEFQEFMRNSKNQYGGWILYNHNIFEQSWKKHFHMEKYHYYVHEIEQLSGIETSESLPLFIQDVIQKIPGITKEEVISHCKWYSKYTYLKERQQRAVDKWKINKKMIKNSNNSKTTQCIVKPMSSGNLCKATVQNRNYERDSISRASVSEKNKESGRLIIKEIRSSLQTSFQDNDVSDKKDFSFNVNYNELNCSEFKLPEEIEKKIDTIKKGLGFIKPTVQWNNRCNSSENSVHRHNMGIENISKL